MTLTLVLNDVSFASAIKGISGLILVDFWAPWCAPCRVLAPALELIAKEFAGELTVAKVNVDANPVTANALGVRSIPSLLFFRDGVLVDSVIGLLPRPELTSRIRLLLSPDGTHGSAAS